MEYLHIIIDEQVHDITEAILVFLKNQWFTLQYLLYLTGFKNIISHFWKGEMFCASFQPKGEKY